MKITYHQFDPLIDKMDEVVEGMEALQQQFGADEAFPIDTLLDMLRVERGLRLQRHRLQQLRDDGRIPGRGSMVRRKWL